MAVNEKWPSRRGLRIKLVIVVNVHDRYTGQERFKTMIITAVTTINFVYTNFREQRKMLLLRF